MIKKLKLIKLLLVIILVSLSANLYSQVLFKAEVKNQVVDRTNLTYGPCVFFDIYLTENTGSSGPLYLADSDFKFHFNVSNFNTPAIEYVPNSAQLYNSLGASITTYESAIATSFITPNQLVINVAGLGISTQTQFNTRVAMIDATPLKHKLGKFVVYTSKLSGTFGLTWITGVGGTVVTTMLPVSPWSTSQAMGTLVVIPDLSMPVEIIGVNVPTKYDISQNYPNPFNPTTKIDFELPFDSKVTIELYDIDGREVMMLVSGEMSAGYYSETFNMSNLPSGAYFYRFSASSNGKDFAMTKKLMLIK
jgi:hypothetical protein